MGDSCAQPKNSPSETMLPYCAMCNTRLSNFVHQTMMTSKVCSVCRIIRHQCKYDLNVCYCSVGMSEKPSKRPMYIQTQYLF